VRKRDPNAVIDAFQAEVAASRSAFLTLLAAARALPVALRRRLAQDSFFSLAVAFEVFRSDWHIAAVSRDLSVLANSLDSEVASVLSGRQHIRGAKAFVRVDIPRHLSLEQTRGLIDPDGSNHTFRHVKVEGGIAERWQAAAKRELADPYRHAIVGIPTRDLKVIQLVEALRDCHAHASPRADVRLASALSALDPGDLLDLGSSRVTHSRLGLYLLAHVNGEPRVSMIHARLDRIVEGMRV
jgi:hypothetical protein